MARLNPTVTTELKDKLKLGDLKDADRQYITRRCPPLKQLGTSLEDIESYVLGESDVAILPKYNYNVVLGPRQKMVERLFEMPRPTFACIFKCLASAANINANHASLNAALFDVIMMSCSRPTVVISVLSGRCQKETARRYNLSLVKGIVAAVRKFTDERFSVVFGILHESDIDSKDNFEKAMYEIISATSAMCTPDSLSMPIRKYKKIVRAFLFSMAVTKSVLGVTDGKQHNTIYSLTKRQFEIMAENLDQQEVHVSTSGGSGRKVLLLEVVRRLEICGPTLLLSDDDKLTDNARSKKVCSFVISSRELKEFLHRRHDMPTERIKSIVTDVEIDNQEVIRHFVKAERLWKFKKVSEQTPQNIDKDVKDKFLKCPVCMEHFNQTDRRPRVLRVCLHVFCTLCLHRLLMKESKAQITCPMCRQVQNVTGNVDTLPVDTVRENLADVLRTRHKEAIVCTDCPDDKPGTYECKECDVYLCTDCENVHTQHRLTRKHCVSSLPKRQKEGIQAAKVVLGENICPLHPENPVLHFCLSCEHTVCEQCRYDNHTNHKILTLQETFDSELQEMDMMDDKSEKSPVTDEAAPSVTGTPVDPNPGDKGTETAVCALSEEMAIQSELMYPPVWPDRCTGSHFCQQETVEPPTVSYNISVSFSSYPTPQPRQGWTMVEFGYTIPICFRCGQPGHLSYSCTNLRGRFG